MSETVEMSNAVVMSNAVEMWSVQSQLVLDTLAEQGTYFVKKGYVRRKYAESSWIFTTAYDFFSREAEKVLPRPKEAEYPVWMFRDKDRAMSSAGGWLMRLSVPREQLILFDLREWDRILNLSPLGSDEERKEIDMELERIGIAHPSDVFRSPFYPLQKKRIVESWEKLLKAPLPEDRYIQGATWLLKREWIQSCTTL